MPADNSERSAIGIATSEGIDYEKLGEIYKRHGFPVVMSVLGRYGIPLRVANKILKKIIAHYRYRKYVKPRLKTESRGMTRHRDMGRRYE